MAALSDPNANVRETALDALGNHPECAPVEPILAALADSGRFVRCAAATALEQLGNRVPETALPALRQMALTDSYPKAREYAAQAWYTLWQLRGGEDGHAERDDEEFLAE